MESRFLHINTSRNIALVAHDNRKQALLEWVAWNRETLIGHNLICTGTTGILVEKVVNSHTKSDEVPVKVKKLKSGPLGGDQQLGALIAEGKIDMLIFLWDSMQPQPHDVDIKALLRLSVLYNIPTAGNRATADFLVSSTLFNSEYIPEIPDYSKYLQRSIESPSQK